MAALCAHLLRRRRIGLLAAAILFYLAVGYPGWNTSPADGWRVLLHVPRLCALVVLTSVALYALRKPLTHTYRRMWWYAGITAILAFSIFSGLQRQRHLYDDYAYRLPMPPQAYFAAQPAALETAVHIIALLPTGYRAANIDSMSTHLDGALYNPSIDQLSFTRAASVAWTEEVAEHSLLRSSITATPSVMDAESPALKPDGRTLAFLREIGGRKHLFVRQLDQPGGGDHELTPDSAWNVEEVAFSPAGSIIMAATHGSANSGLYVVRNTGRIDPINVGEARYPAVSPDGRWLAFSGLQSGNWNLYLREIATGATRRLTNSPCNQMEPAWEADSKTLLYRSDCGRSLWFTAICRRRVLP